MRAAGEDLVDSGARETVLLREEQVDELLVRATNDGSVGVGTHGTVPPRFRGECPNLVVVEVNVGRGAVAGAGGLVQIAAHHRPHRVHRFVARQAFADEPRERRRDRRFVEDRRLILDDEMHQVV
jgi:hypothetical protein